MLAIDRRKSIMKTLVDKQSVLVVELSKQFNVTEETIRRDLEKMEREGLLKRTYGGAVLLDSLTPDLPVSIREVANINGKEKIGLRASQLVKDGDTLIIDSSTTALQVAKNIKNKRLTVITNSDKVILELAGCKDIKLISTGGTLKNSSMSFVGPQAERAVRSYNADIFFMSCGGFSKEKGLMEANELEAEIKKAMMSSARLVVLLLDNTKMDRVAFATIAPISEISTIVTDVAPPEETVKELQKHKINIICCE